MKKFDYKETKTVETGRIITLHVYTLKELSDEARARAFENWREELDPDYISFELENLVDYDMRRTLATAGVDYDSDSYGRTWPDMRKAEIVQTGEAPVMVAMGDCWTDDAAAAFNAHGARLGELAAQWYRAAFPEYDSEYYDMDDGAYYDLLANIEDEYLHEFEDAAADALKVWDDAREAEYEYMTSREAFEDEFTQGYECYSCEYPYYSNGGYTGRKYYTDTRLLYTEDGELFDGAGVCHECVSIVRAGR